MMLSGGSLRRTRHPTFLSTKSTFLFGLCYISIWISTFQQVAAEQPIDKAILSAYGANDPKTFEFFCIPYNHEFHVLPHHQKSAQFHQLMDFTPDTGCSDIYSQINISNTLVAVSRGDCNFAVKAALISKNGGIGVLNVSPDNKTEIIPGGNSSDYYNINITVALIREEDFLSLKQLGENIMVKLFSPQPSLLDSTEFIILLLAMSSIIIGSYWSGVSFFNETNMKKIDKKQKVSQRDENTDAGGHKPLEDETKTEISPEDRGAKSVFAASIPVVIVMICVMSTFLLGLYFLYDYLVYVVIFMFTVTSAVAFYTCFKGIWNFLIPGEQRLQYLLCRCYRFDMRIKEIPLAIISISIAIIWFVFRHAKYSWILQDFLGLLFCIHVLKNIRIPSLKAGTIFLTLAFLYDIFFVFITPFFTSNGSSVMIDVATGGRSHNSREQEPHSSMPRSVNNPDSKSTVNPSRGNVEILPLVFRVPRFYLSPLSVCFVQESLLGFGDIMLPGVLIVYNHIFDIYARTKKLYFVLSIIAYLLGLILAFVALSIMKIGQPALLYLVPCELLFTVIPAWIRGDLKEMWTGNFLIIRDQSDPEVSEITETGPETIDDPQMNNANPQQTSVTIGGKEDDHLLSS